MLLNKNLLASAGSQTPDPWLCKEYATGRRVAVAERAAAACGLVTHVAPGC
jgi:hypothetical protein